MSGFEKRHVWMNGGWGKYHGRIHFLLWCRCLNVLRIGQSRPPSSVSAEDVYGTDGLFSIKHPRLFFYSATLKPCLELFAVILVSFTLSLCPPLPFVDKAEVKLCYVRAPLPFDPSFWLQQTPCRSLLCIKAGLFKSCHGNKMRQSPEILGWNIMVLFLVSPPLLF